MKQIKIIHLNAQEKTEKSKIDGNLINGTIGQSEQKELTEKTYSEATTSIEVQKTYWNRNNSDMQSNFQKADTRDNTKANSMYYELLCNNGTSHYWLASRYANTNHSSNADFGLRRVDYGDVSGNNVFSSGAGVYYYYNRVRPVVSLPSNIINIDTDYNTAKTWKLK